MEVVVLQFGCCCCRITDLFFGLAVWAFNLIVRSENHKQGLLRLLRLMDKILHDPKDPKLWELWYIPYNG